MDTVTLRIKRYDGVKEWYQDTSSPMKKGKPCSIP